MPKAASRISFLFLAALSASTSAQAVSLSDLDGLIVEADVHRDQNMWRQGGRVSVKVNQSWKISFGNENSIRFAVNTTVRTSDGIRTAPQNAGTFTLDEPREVASRGGGEAVWTFLDETLTFIRTFRSGAYRIHFAFARGSSGLTCTVTEAFAREGENGEIKMQSPFGGEVSIISTKQLPSSCKVSKKR
jgi:hypothetical protein